MTKCELFDNCGFLKKHVQKNELACQGIMRMYCEGGKHSDCARKRIVEEAGVTPSDDLLPNGKYIAETHSEINFRNDLFVRNVFVNQ